MCHTFGFSSFNFKQLLYLPNCRLQIQIKKSENPRNYMIGKWKQYSGTTCTYVQDLSFFADRKPSNLFWICRKVKEIIVSSCISYIFYTSCQLLYYKLNKSEQIIYYKLNYGAQTFIMSI